LIDGGFDKRVVDIEMRIAGGVAGLKDGGDAKGIEADAIDIRDEAVKILELVFVEVGEKKIGAAIDGGGDLIVSNGGRRHRFGRRGGGKIRGKGLGR
jgi:hypothetical protein